MDHNRTHDADHSPAHWLWISSFSLSLAKQEGCNPTKNGQKSTKILEENVFLSVETTKVRHGNPSSHAWDTQFLDTPLLQLGINSPIRIIFPLFPVFENFVPVFENFEPVFENFVPSRVKNIYSCDPLFWIPSLIHSNLICRRCAPVRMLSVSVLGRPMCAVSIKCKNHNSNAHVFQVHTCIERADMWQYKERPSLERQSAVHRVLFIFGLVETVQKDVCRMQKLDDKTTRGLPYLRGLLPASCIQVPFTTCIVDAFLRMTTRERVPSKNLKISWYKYSKIASNKKSQILLQIFE